MGLTLPAVEARLVAMGLGRLLSQLLEGNPPGPIPLPFGTVKQAAGLQRLLYRWLWFNPEVKARISLRLDEPAATLVILPKAGPERRGGWGRPPLA